MRRKFAVLALPVAALAIAGVMSLSNLGAAPTMTAPVGGNSGQVAAAQVDAGSGAALSLTNWQETGTPSTVKGPGKITR